VTSLALYWRTLRHLKPVQVYGRARFRLSRPRPDLRPPPARRSRVGTWLRPARRRASLIGPETFVLLNRAGRIAAAADWDSPEHDRLWLYNLHYFDDLAAEGAQARVDWHRLLIARWIAENPPGAGTGWEPYPLSLRVVNWIKWTLAGNPLAPDVLASLAVQARFLRARLEWHLLGNHLLANGKALVFAGLFFEGPEAEAWLATGLDILAREIPEQVLADGGHFERSPMYHALVFEDLLDLINLAGSFPGVVPAHHTAEWRQASERMQIWLAAMTHPDGRIAFFNDAAFGVAPEPRELFDYARRLGLGDAAPADPVTHLAHSGYVRLASGPAVALLDVAPVGPDYLPGHAHADTLSFELSLFGERLIVNSGTSVYGGGSERQRQRATAAHSTVEIDGENSSEVWGAFRVARRARPFALTLGDSDGRMVVTCAHDGYHRLPGRVTHRREWMLGRGSLSVSDRIEGRFKRAVARYFLHPAASAAGNDKEGTIAISAGRVARWTVEGGRATIAASAWHPEFGRSEPAQCLEVEAGPHCRVTLHW
jgi:uncharacterized heparinase superfamily protein